MNSGFRLLLFSFFIMACAEESQIVPTPDGAAAIVVTTDYQTGSYAVVDVDSRQVWKSVDLVHQDASCRVSGPTPFIVGRRGADAIEVLSRERWNVVSEYSVGAGSNPQDIAVVSDDRAYVALYAEPYVLVVHPRTGQKIGQVDLSTFADADGIPEVGWLHAFEGNVYALLQRLDRNNMFLPADTGLVVELDGASGQVVRAIPTLGTNPAGKLRYSDAAGGFVIISSGQHGAMLNNATVDGGIELFDPVAGTIAPLADAATLGGDVVDAVVASQSKGYAIIGIHGGTNGRTRLVSFQPSTGALLNSLIDSVGWDLGFMELTPDGRELWVTIRVANAPGIRIFSVGEDTELTTHPIDTGLPPYMVCFLPR